MEKDKSSKARHIKLFSAGLHKEAIVWFSRLLPNLGTIKGSSVAKRKARAEYECRAILAGMTKDWQIPPKGFRWDAPRPPGDRYKLTVWIMPKRKSGVPVDPPIPAPKPPPPSM